MRGPLTRDRRAWARLAGLGSAVLMLAGGCRTTAPLEHAAVPLFLLEAPAGGPAGTPPGRRVEMPVSGTAVVVDETPFFSLSDLASVHHARVDLGECLLFRMTEKGARKLYRTSVAERGKRLVLLINREPVGFLRFDQPLADGNLFLFVEVPDTRLPALVGDIQATLDSLKAGHKL